MSTVESAEKISMGALFRNRVIRTILMGAMMITMSVAGTLKEIFSLVAIFDVSVVLFVVGIFVMLPLLKQPDLQPQAGERAVVQE